MVYKIECLNRHIIDVNESELDEILEFNLCPQCDGELKRVDPENIDVGCTMCGWEESTPWQEVGNYVYTGCPNCGRYIPDSNVHVLNSFFYKTYEYLDHAQIKDTEGFKRKDRPDYWEILTHFCSRDEFISILNDNQIKASPTGYYKKDAICFTETPIVYASEIRKKHGDYGFSFEMNSILENGGQPVIHITDNLRHKQEYGKGFAEELKPFIQLLRIPQIAPIYANLKRYNFMYEREWRLPNDLDLNEVKPVGIILPEGYDSSKFSGTGWEELLNAAYHYREISY